MRTLAPLERQLRNAGAGKALFDPFSLGCCATGASAYRMPPAGVVVPQTLEQAETAKVSRAMGDLARLPATRAAQADAHVVTNRFSYGCRIEPRTERHAVHVAEILAMDLEVRSGYGTVSQSKTQPSPKGIGMTRRLSHLLAGLLMSLASAPSATSAIAEPLEVFHADSLAGPMGALKRAFEAHHPEISIHLTSGVSKQLAERILNGETCDVYASSSPLVIEQDLMKGSVKGAAQPAASWYAIFSANEMVLIVRTGNPLGIGRISDLAKPGLRFVRVTGEKDLATGRTVEFVKRATALEGNPDLARNIISAAPDDPSRPIPVPAVVRAVLDGRADAGIVYYSAAVAAGPDISIIRYPASVNMSEAIRNAISVPATARNPVAAEAFARFLLEPEGRKILEATGQPPVIPAVRVGASPTSLRD